MNPGFCNMINVFNNRQSNVDSLSSLEEIVKESHTLSIHQNEINKFYLKTHRKYLLETAAKIF